MRLRPFPLVVGFTAVNFFGVLIFYGWVVSKQVWQVTKLPNAVFDISHSGLDLKVTESKGFSDLYLPIEKRRPSVLHSKSKNSEGHLLKQAKKNHPLSMIPEVPKISTSDDVPFLDEEITKTFRDYPKKPANDTILILSPIHNVSGKLKRFLGLLQSINYPHKLISIAFGEDSSHDNTLHHAHDIAKELRKSFADVRVFHFKLRGRQVNGSWSNTHSKSNQWKRRHHLAQARNALWKAGLKAQAWTLWIDSDVSSFPPDIIQQLLSAERDIVAPLCLYMDGSRKRVYDKNTWRETYESLAYQKTLTSDELMLEGYESTKRLWLADLRAEGRVVPIDGVGGCVLLVKSKCHKEGLNFPEKLFHNHIETEGLAKLAKYMGFGVFGMPFVEVYH